MTASSNRQVATHDIAQLYRQHHRRLQRVVAATVRAPQDVVEDACQNAWTIMLRTQPRQETWFAWLRVVAIHQAWEQSTRMNHEMPAGAFISPDPNELDAREHPEPAADTRDIPDQVADRIQLAQRLADLAAIKPNDRRALCLKGLGYRYREIMQITGASYTAVNRRITEGRRALYRLERARTNGNGSPSTRGSGKTARGRGATRSREGSSLMR